MNAAAVVEITMSTTSTAFDVDAAAATDDDAINIAATATNSKKCP